MAYGKPSAPDPVDTLKAFLKADGARNGAFCFCGEEEYLKQFYLDALRRRILDVPGGESFDGIRLSGVGSDDPALGLSLADRVGDAVSMPPMLCSGKLIELHDVGLKAVSQNDLDTVIEIAKEIGSYPDTVLVLVMSEEELPTQDYRAENGALYKQIASAFQMIPFHRQKREKLVPWCLRHFRDSGVSAGEDVAGALVDRVGRSMCTLDGEIRKLSWYALAHGRTNVAKEDIAELCPQNEESVTFGFSNAVMERRVDDALREYRLAKRDKTDEIAVFAQVFSAVMDLYRVKRALEDGIGESAIPAACKLNPYRAGLLVRACGKYTLAELTELARCGAGADYQLKYTMLDKSVVLCRFLCAMARRDRTE